MGQKVVGNGQSGQNVGGMWKSGQNVGGMRKVGKTWGEMWKSGQNVGENVEKWAKRGGNEEMGTYIVELGTCGTCAKPFLRGDVAEMSQFTCHGKWKRATQEEQDTGY